MSYIVYKAPLAELFPSKLAEVGSVLQAFWISPMLALPPHFSSEKE